MNTASVADADVQDLIKLPMEDRYKVPVRVIYWI